MEETKRQRGRPKGSNTWNVDPLLSDLSSETLDSIKQEKEDTKRYDGTWVRYIEGKDEKGLGFNHQLQVIDVEGGTIVRERRSERRGLISLEPILVKVVKSLYKKGKIDDNRFMEIQ